MPTLRKGKSKDDPYARIDKKLLEDNRISWKSKGIMCYVLSKPDDWVIRVTDLVKHGDMKEDGIYSALKELIKLGYVERNKIIDPKTKRIKEWEYIIHEEPLRGFPDKAQPDEEVPHKENPDYTKKESTKTKSTKTYTDNNQYNKPTYNKPYKKLNNRSSHERQYDARELEKKLLGEGEDE